MQQADSPLQIAQAGLKGGHLIHRAISVIEEVDIATRRVPMCISSDEPKESCGWQQILVHTPQAINTDRIANAEAPAPFLLDHRYYESHQQIGAIDPETIKIEQGKLRVVAVLGAGELADRMLQDMANGIRRQVSVGARVLKFELDEEQKIERITEWQPFECSLVPIAADMKAGVARQEEIVDNAAVEATKTARPGEVAQMAKTDTEQKQSVEDIRRQFAEEARQREGKFADAVKDIPQELKLRAAELVTNARTQDGDQLVWLQGQLVTLMAKAANDAAAKAAEAQKNAGSIQRAAAEEAGIEGGAGATKALEKQQSPAVLSGDKTFNITRAINMHRDGKMDGRELDVHEEGLEIHNSMTSVKGVKRERATGLMLPKKTIALYSLTQQAQDGHRHAIDTLRSVQASHPEVIQRAQDGTASTGLINDSLLPNLFIEALRPMTGIMQWGVRVLDNLREDVDVPEQTSVTAGQWIDPDMEQDPTQTSATFADVPLSMKTFAALVQYTRKALKQSRPAVDQLIASDIMRTIAIAIQDAALTGDGTSNSPTGIENTTSVISRLIPSARTTGSGANQITSPNRDDILGLLGEIGDENADMSMARWVMRPSRFYAMLGQVIDSGSGLFLIDRMSKMLEGFAVEQYSQLDNNTFIFGNFPDMMLGFFGEQMEYRADIHVPGGGRHDRIYCDMDVALRHKKAFAVAAAA